MCKYCEADKNGGISWILNDRRLGNYCDSYVGINMSIDKDRLEISACTESTNGGSEYIERDVAINFCPKCGTPLGEVKALTVEQLRDINADVENRKWIYIKCLVDFCCADKETAYYRSQMDYTNGRAFCCGYPGLGFSFDYSEYGTTWQAFDREPKGEAE